MENSHLKSFSLLFVAIISLFLVFSGYSFADTKLISPNENKEANSTTNEQAEKISIDEKKLSLTNKTTTSVKIKVPPSTHTANKLSDNQERENRNNTGQDKMERYTFWLSISTGLLFLATLALCFITYLLKKIAKQEFSATHRPKIIVHTFENSTGYKNRIGPIFTYVNSGTTNATIKSISSNIFYTDNLRPGADMKSFKCRENKTIKPGARSTFLVESKIETNSATIEGMRNQRGQSNLELMCIGKICYSDSSGAERETGFCRKFDSVTNCWLKVENSDYEYSY